MAFFIFKIPARHFIADKSLDCGNASFRLTAAVLQHLKVFIFHTFRHLCRRTRTHSVADVYSFNGFMEKMSFYIFPPEALALKIHFPALFEFIFAIPVDKITIYKKT